MQPVGSGAAKRTTQGIGPTAPPLSLLFLILQVGEALLFCPLAPAHTLCPFSTSSSSIVKN